MKKKFIAILVLMLMMVPCLGTITVLADPGNGDNIQWITIYTQPAGEQSTPVVNLMSPMNPVPYTDLSIYNIQVGHIVGNSFRLKYYLSVATQFTGSFSDGTWIDTTLIQYVSQSGTFNAGINGPYYTQWFPVNGKGYHDVTVYTDYIPQPNGAIPEYTEYNNQLTISHLFTWIGQ